MRREIEKRKHIQNVNRIVEERQNTERTVVKEVFGLSADERKAKQIQIKLKQAFNEIEDFDFTQLVSMPSKTNYFKDDMTIIKNSLVSAKQHMPTFNELLPIMFDVEDAKGGLIYTTDRYGRQVKRIFPAAWFNVVSKGRNENGQHEVDAPENMKMKAKVFLSKKFNKKAV